MSSQARSALLTVHVWEWFEPALGWARFVGRLRRTRFALAGLIIIFVVAFAALLAAWISPYDPNLTDGYRSLELPSLEHPVWIGHPGPRCVQPHHLRRPHLLSVGIVAVLIGALAGVPLGIVSGYFGGRVDDVVMRFMDAMYAFPSILLAMAMVAALGPTVVNLMIAIGVTSVPIYARIERSLTLSVKRQDYTIAARASGASDIRIMALYIWPNITAPIIVQASLGMAAAILAEASLSFLSVGVRPPTSTWGGMLNDAFPLVYRAPWLSLFPGMAIFVVTFALNVVGDALRDTLDPVLSRRTDVA